MQSIKTSSLGLKFTYLQWKKRISGSEGRSRKRNLRTYEEAMRTLSANWLKLADGPAQGERLKSKRKLKGPKRLKGPGRFTGRVAGFLLLTDTS